jgi:hypothetical protein
MKKVALVVLTAVSLGGCSWFQQSSDWADRTFFGANPNPNPNTQPPGNNYPYYYTSAAPIDANEKAGYSSPYPVSNMRHMTHLHRWHKLAVMAFNQTLLLSAYNMAVRVPM